MPHYYGCTSAVQLCPTITATLQESSRAPLLRPHVSITVIVHHYYGPTHAGQLQSPRCFGRTSTIPSWCSPIMSTPASQSGSQYNGCTSSFHLSSPVLWPHTGSPALVSHCCDHTSAIQSWCSPFCGHTGCPVRLPPLWPHTISPVVVLTPTASCIDTEIRWSI